METFNEMVDRLFADSEEELQAFCEWLSTDAADSVVRDAMAAVMQPWMNCAEREMARVKLARAIGEERG